MASSMAARSARDSGRSSRRRVSRPEATTSHTEEGTPEDGPGPLGDEAHAVPVPEVVEGCVEEPERPGGQGA